MARGRRLRSSQVVKAEFRAEMQAADVNTPPSAKPCAYVTLVTNDDFAVGAMGLLRSVQACGAAHPLLVMATYASPAVDALAARGAQVIEVTPPQVSEGFAQRHGREAVHRNNPFTKGNKPAFHSPLDNFCKLRIWEMEEYERLVFLDADTLMIRPCDRLFAYPEFSAAPNLYETLADMHRLNSGVFVAQPSKATYGAMMERLDAPEAYWPRTDQTFLETFFPDWHGLPYLYNCLQYVYFNMPALWSWQSIHLIHYQYEKPWQSDHPKAVQLAPLIALWRQVHDHGTLPDFAKLAEPAELAGLSGHESVA